MRAVWRHRRTPRHKGLLEVTFVAASPCGNARREVFDLISPIFQTSGTRLAMTDDVDGCHA